MYLITVVTSHNTLVEAIMLCRNIPDHKNMIIVLKFVAILPIYDRPLYTAN